MMLYRTKKSVLQAVLTLLWLLFSYEAQTEQVSHADCRIARPAAEKNDQALEFSDALLWQISKQGYKPSYLFGTIHVSDPEITNLPELVSSKLDSTGIFVMEALPEPEEAIKLSQMMFFADGRMLTDFIDDGLFKQTTSILSTYQLSSESVLFIKPWAAFLIMNYPTGDGPPLDLHLLGIAQQNGADTYGLETLTEQGDVFSNIDMDVQIRFLLDTVCNYEIIKSDFEKMKSLYLKRNLQGLFDYSNKYSFSEEKIYKDLVKKLLVDRNYVMVERMQKYLDTGNAFIAIGAMHLPGKEGVLALLEKEGYQIVSIY